MGYFTQKNMNTFLQLLAATSWLLKGFQMNIDFDTHVMIPNQIKREAIKKYLLHFQFFFLFRFS